MAYSWETLGAEEKNAILAGIASGEATLAPRVVELNWQDRCNIDCFFCSTGEQRAGNFEMPAERVLSLFDEMRAMNVKGIRLAGGGEPLFRKDAAALVAEAGARGLRFTDVTTNGVLLTDPVARALFSAGCDEITVSLNAGTAASYERMMQTTARNFDRVVENVARAVAVRDEAHARCKIRVQFLVYRENYREIPRMLEVFRKSGADRFWLNGLFPVRPMPTMSEEDIAGMLQLYEGVLEGDYFERLESFSFWERSIASRIAESERAVFRRAPLSVRARVKWRQLFDRRQKERSAAASLHEFCLVGWYSTTISANGDVVPCCILQDRPTAVLGNVHSTSLSEIWYGAAYRRFRAELSEIMARKGGIEDFSGACVVEDVCVKKGFCPNRSFYWGDDVAFRKRFHALVEATPAPAGDPFESLPPGALPSRARPAASALPVR
jgi:radical SAM protein with 4Fe4S-binding SPASM domain